MKIEIEGRELENILWLTKELHEQDNDFLEHPLYVVYEKHPTKSAQMIQAFLTAFIARKFIEQNQRQYHPLQIRVQSASGNPEFVFLREFLMAKRWSEYAAPVAPQVKPATPRPTAPEYSSRNAGDPIAPGPETGSSAHSSRHVSSGILVPETSSRNCATLSAEQLQKKDFFA